MEISKFFNFLNLGKNLRLEKTVFESFLNVLAYNGLIDKIDNLSKNYDIINYSIKGNQLNVSITIEEIQKYRYSKVQNLEERIIELEIEINELTEENNNLKKTNTDLILENQLLLKENEKLTKLIKEK